MTIQANSDHTSQYKKVHGLTRLLTDVVWSCYLHNNAAAILCVGFTGRMEAGEEAGRLNTKNFPGFGVPFMRHFGKVAGMLTIRLHCDSNASPTYQSRCIACAGLVVSSVGEALLQERHDGN